VETLGVAQMRRGKAFCNQVEILGVAQMRRGKAFCSQMEPPGCAPTRYALPALAFNDSSAAKAVMLTMPREVTDGVRICAGLATPSMMGPTCSASVIALMVVRVILAESRSGNTSRFASPS